MPVLIRSSSLSKEDKKKYPYATGAVIIIVYSEGHFEGFYDKHCGRVDIRSPEYTVLVVNEVLCPREKDFRRDFEKAITTSRFEIHEDKIFLNIPEQYKFRHYSGRKDMFLDEMPGEGNMKIRDCKRLRTEKDYAYLLKTGEITQSEINIVNSIREGANHENIAVKFVLFLGHIDIVKFS